MTNSILVLYNCHPENARPLVAIEFPVLVTD